MAKEHDTAGPDSGAKDLPATSMPDWATKARTFVIEWREIIPLMALGLTQTLTAVGLSTSTANRISVLFVALFVAFVVWRFVPRRKVERRDDGTERGRSAIRGLAPFRRGDRLPGATRRAEAQQLFTRVADHAVRFFVLTGPSGVGKSSLISSAFVEAAVKGGSFVELLPYSGYWFTGDHRSSDAGARLELFTAMLAGAAQRCSHRPLIVVCDQGEQLLTAMASVEHRRDLGRAIQALLDADDDVKVVWCVRSDYFSEVLDVAAGLNPPPQLVTQRFVLRALTEREVVEVIDECAESDGITPEHGFVRRLAQTLTERGDVRPVEIQLVCVALRHDFTSQRLLSCGGVTGLLSNYVSEALAGTKQPYVAQRLLRALCDESRAARRTEPVSAAELARQQPSQSIAALVELLETLEAAQIVTRVGGDHIDTWGLAHDYLAGPVLAATEAASQKEARVRDTLSYVFGAPAAMGPPVVSLRQLWNVYRDAPLGTFRTRRARQLLIRTALRGVVLPAATIAIVAATVATGLLVATAERGWYRTTADASLGKRSDSFITTTSCDEFVIQQEVPFFQKGDQRVMAWNRRTGATIGTLSAQHIVVDCGRLFVLGATREPPLMTWFNLREATKHELQAHLEAGFAPSPGDPTQYVDDELVGLRSSPAGGQVARIDVFSRPQKRLLFAVAGQSVGFVRLPKEKWFGLSWQAAGDSGLSKFEVRDSTTGAVRVTWSPDAGAKRFAVTCVPEPVSCISMNVNDRGRAVLRRVSPETGETGAVNEVEGVSVGSALLPWKDWIAVIEYEQSSLPPRFRALFHAQDLKLDAEAKGDAWLAFGVQTVTWIVPRPKGGAELHQPGGGPTVQSDVWSSPRDTVYLDGEARRGIVLTAAGTIEAIGQGRPPRVVRTGLGKYSSTRLVDSWILAQRDTGETEVWDLDAVQTGTLGGALRATDIMSVDKNCGEMLAWTYEGLVVRASNGYRWGPLLVHSHGCHGRVTWLGDGVASR